MNSRLATADYLVFLVYFIIVAGYGYWIYQKKKNTHNDDDSFRSLNIILLSLASYLSL